MEKASEGKVLVTVTTEDQVTRCGDQAAKQETFSEAGCGFCDLVNFKYLFKLNY